MIIITYSFYYVAFWQRKLRRKGSCAGFLPCGVHAHASTGHWNMTCSARKLNQKTPACFQPVLRWVVVAVPPAQAVFSSTFVRKSPRSLDVKHLLQLFLGLWLTCGCLWERVQGKLIVYFGTQHGHVTAQSRTHCWHHTQAQCAGMSSPGKSQRPSWAHSDDSFVGQLSLWALNCWPPLAKSFQDGKGTKIHISDLIWKLLNVKNDHRTINSSHSARGKDSWKPSPVISWSSSIKSLLAYSWDNISLSLIQIQNA